MLENDNQYHLLNRRDRFAPDELIINFRQKMNDDHTRPESKFTYPSAKQYPKNFNTKIEDLNKQSAMFTSDPAASKAKQNLCVITN
jgi:hypothetical protein